MHRLLHHQHEKMITQISNRIEIAIFRSKSNRNQSSG